MLEGLLAAIATKLITTAALWFSKVAAIFYKERKQEAQDTNNTKKFEESLNGDIKERDKAQHDLINGTKPK